MLEIVKDVLPSS